MSTNRAHTPKRHPPTIAGQRRFGLRLNPPSNSGSNRTHAVAVCVEKLSGVLGNPLCSTIVQVRNDAAAALVTLVVVEMCSHSAFCQRFYSSLNDRWYRVKQRSRADRQTFPNCVDVWPAVCYAAQFIKFTPLP